MCISVNTSGGSDTGGRGTAIWRGGLSCLRPCDYSVAKSNRSRVPDSWSSIVFMKAVASWQRGVRGAKHPLVFSPNPQQLKCCSSERQTLDRFAHSAPRCSTWPASPSSQLFPMLPPLPQTPSKHLGVITDTFLSLIPCVILKKSCPFFPCKFPIFSHLDHHFLFGLKLNFSQCGFFFSLPPGLKSSMTSYDC